MELFAKWQQQHRHCNSMFRFFQFLLNIENRRTFHFPFWVESKTNSRYIHGPHPDPVQFGLYSVHRDVTEEDVKYLAQYIVFQQRKIPDQYLVVGLRPHIYAAAHYCSVSTGRNGIASLRSSVRPSVFILTFELSDLWPWPIACVWVMTMTLGQWRQRSKLVLGLGSQFERRSVGSRSSVEDSFLAVFR